MLNYAMQDRVAILTLDDGKANAVGHAFIDAVHEGLDRAATDAQAVVLTGREGIFSAGFDLKEFQQGAQASAALAARGAALMLRLFSFELPVVAAASGHAIAAGALLLLTADTRIGVRGDFKVGLNETAIGMDLPVFALELVRARLAPPQQTAAFIQAELYTPHEALTVGFVDELTDPPRLLEVAVARAAALGELPTAAYAANKRNLRQPAIAAIAGSLSADGDSADRHGHG